MGPIVDIQDILDDGNRAARRMVLGVALSVVALAAILTLQGYRETLVQAEALTLERLETTARLAALQLDGDAHAAILRTHTTRDALSTNDQDARYHLLHNTLAEIQARAGLHTPVYTYFLDSATQTFRFGVTSAPEPYFRHALTTFPAELHALYASGGALPAYTDEHGTWLSGLAPVRDWRGRVVAVVQVDERFDAFVARTTATAFTRLGVSLLALALLIGVLLHFLTRNLKREWHGREAIAEAFHETRRLGDELEAKERDLRTNAAMLERSNRDLTDFANVASHDLRSPLRGIASFAQLLARRNRATLDRESNEYLDFILANARRAIDLTDGLLDYAKAGQSARAATRFPLAEAVGNAVDNLNHTLAERGARVTVGDLPQATGDQALLTQIFQNLIANGIKYNHSAQPEVHVDTYRDAETGAWVLTVRDNGIGIPAEYRAAVFEMFRRVHSTGDYEGSGIGLAYCSRVVDGYGGTIWVESVEGEGSTFSLTLPRALVGGSVASGGVKPGAVAGEPVRAVG